MGTIYDNDTCNFFNISSKYVFLAICTAVAQPFSFGWPNKCQEEKRDTSGTITLGLTVSVLKKLGKLKFSILKIRNLKV